MDNDNKDIGATIELLTKGAAQVIIWRKQIDELVKTFLGLLGGVTFEKALDFYDTSGKCYWRIVVAAGRAAGIEYHRKTSPGSESEVLYSTSQKNSSCSMPLAAVKIVYDDLYNLRDQLIGYCPLFAHRLEPLIEAGEYAERMGM